MNVELLSEAVRTAAGYEGATYHDLCSEIGDGFMGETGDLIREHANFVLALRSLRPAIEGGLL